MLVILFGFFISAQAALLESKPESGSLKFLTTVSPSSLKITGVSEAPKGRLQVDETAAELEISGEFRFPLEKLSTGLSLRDNHLKTKYLEVGTYPEAVLTLKKQKFPKAATGSVPFEGEMTLHGKMQKVKGNAILRNGAGESSVKADFPLKLQDFAIERPAFAGLTVAEDVNVETEIFFHKTDK